MVPLYHMGDVNFNVAFFGLFETKLKQESPCAPPSCLLLVPLGFCFENQTRSKKTRGIELHIGEPLLETNEIQLRDWIEKSFQRNTTR